MTEENRAPEAGVKHKTGHAKVAAVTSTVLWILGFGLAFVIPKGSFFIFLPDTLLLIGFWPLLWAWKPGWPWLVFGVLNVVIGFFLLVAFFLQAKEFTPEMVAVRNHLAEQHSPYSWMIIGVISAVFGIFRMSLNMARWIKRRRSIAAQTQTQTQTQSESEKL